MHTPAVLVRSERGQATSYIVESTVWVRHFEHDEALRRELPDGGCEFADVVGVLCDVQRKQPRVDMDLIEASLSHVEQDGSGADALTTIKLVVWNDDIKHFPAELQVATTPKRVVLRGCKLHDNQRSLARELAFTRATRVDVVTK